MPAAVILAGGTSTRFGSDKARAQWRGRPLLGHVLQGLPAERTGTILVQRAAQGAPGAPGLRLVPDDESLPAGPLRGLIAGLAACDDPWAWVVACDQPALVPDLLRRLAAGDLADHEAVVPRFGGRSQPLVALYRTDVHSRLRARLVAGHRSLGAALDGLSVRWLAEEECRRVDPAGLSFLNINHPAQLAALDRLAAGPGGPGSENRT